MNVNLVCPKCFAMVASIPLDLMDASAIAALRALAPFHVCETSPVSDPLPQISQAEIADLER
jgi:hypothetical protein